MVTVLVLVLGRIPSTIYTSHGTTILPFLVHPPSTNDESLHHPNRASLQMCRRAKLAKEDEEGLSAKKPERERQHLLNDFVSCKGNHEGTRDQQSPCFFLELVARRNRRRLVYRVDAVYSLLLFLEALDGKRLGSSIIIGIVFLVESDSQY